MKRKIISVLVIIISLILLTFGLSKMLKGENKTNEANDTNSINTNYITNSYIENYIANRVIINIGEMDTEEEAIQTDTEDSDLFN